MISSGRHNTRQPDPTPEEIQEACRQFQASWSPKEERRRRRWSESPRYTFPEIYLVTRESKEPND